MVSVKTETLSYFYNMNKAGIAIHGGAGTILRSSMTAEKEQQYTAALREALDAGYDILKFGGSAIDAIETAIKSMEDCPLFNAGKGSVYNNAGKHEMDASIMCGKDISAGAVSLIRNVKNPISLARAVMEKSEHVFLCGDGAEEFAREMNLHFEPDSYFDTAFRAEQWMQAKKADATFLDHNVPVSDKKFGTVGAVALDINGNLAAGTSTGGMTNKKYGRIGDSPIIGAGTYANNKTCAISCTGHGELFIRSVVAYDISCLMEYKGLSLADACHEVVMNKLMAIKGEGGLIAIDRNGNIEMPFNSDGMYRAMKNENSEVISIYK
jgi:beta-aspartyl-peptidase (threonine type)